MGRSSATALKKAPPLPDTPGIEIPYAPARTGENNDGEIEPFNEPERKHPMDAGLDLTITRHIMIHSNHRALIPHNIRVAIPPGYFGQIVPRSSTFHKTGLIVLNGVLDAGYRGEVQTVVWNSGGKGVQLHPGDRLSQLLILPIIPVRFELTEAEMLDAGDRGEAGFGSTGTVETNRVP